MNESKNAEGNYGLIFGNNFEGNPVSMKDIKGETGPIILEGEVFSYEQKDIRNGKSVIMIGLTDRTDSIKVKLFVDQKQIPALQRGIYVGTLLRIKGSVLLDSFDNELSLQKVVGIRSIADTKHTREDNAAQKRVELHCHTNMSEMDGVSDVKDLMHRAASWGHKALAITDHGVVQSFTTAFHELPKIRKENPDFKVIYGLEGYLVDDLAGIVVNSKGQSLGVSYVVFDLETTGFSVATDSIIEIGAVKIINGEIQEHYSTFVNPGKPIPGKITELTSIDDQMVQDAPPIEKALPDFFRFCGDSVLVAHNARFDMGFVNHNARNLEIEQDYTYLDTLAMARAQLPGLGRFKLDNVAKALKIPLNHHHRAVDDAECAAQIFLKLTEDLIEKGVSDFNELRNYCQKSADYIKKSIVYHVTILVQNEIGRKNLYKLVSESNLKYYHYQPRIPKSLLETHREGLIIGSACNMGELFRAILEEKNEEDVAEIASFYDFLEIQPIENNAYLVEDERYENIQSTEDLIRINQEIIRFGEKLGKPVVATGDVHFVNPEDVVFRSIIKTSMGFSAENKEASLYFRTTDEMLGEFSYLPEDKAYEVVVTNSNLIADMIGDVEPVRPDKYPPVIDNSDEILREMCYGKAHELYGDNLPAIVEKRLKTELDSIIGNGYSVLYIIGEKLVDKSIREGYLVGSRGSVGSSFAAFTAGITEVNPLSPHYLCPKCKYSDFDSEEVRRFKGAAGYDLPDCVCPICGTSMRKEGFDIPFEVFLGFAGDKEPDIDLNFSGDIQSKIHMYTKEIFGEENCFKAGTIGTIAERSAYGYVKKYLEEQGISKRRAEIERLAKGCIGIKRGTGQHPGGIMVLPKGEDINSFTPIQYPANDADSAFVTTHFDYHSIDHNLLKLDLLGHDDPTMLKFLKDYTGFDPREVPFDDATVMKLFQTTDALGITPDQIGGTKVGCLGIPEFGTDFAMSMILEAKPKKFSDLVRLAGLAHGTDVWLGNAQDLIRSDVATISSCICCRDDIMTFLIEKGIDKHMAFVIMESVRKGRGLSEEMEKTMSEAGIPGWYIDSCKKIKYMFPKAHAAAYVMMAWRIAYYKIYYPQAFYAAWFTIRAWKLSYEKMFQGADELNEYLSEYRSRKYLSPSEKDEYSAMRVAEEMYARGIEVEPINLKKADPARFTVHDGRIMPSLVSIGGIGEKVAEQIICEANDKPFSSVDDFRARTKCPQTVVDNMMQLGLLKGIPNPKQMNLFEYFGD